PHLSSSWGVLPADSWAAGDKPPPYHPDTPRDILLCPWRPAPCVGAAFIASGPTISHFRHVWAVLWAALLVQPHCPFPPVRLDRATDASDHPQTCSRIGELVGADAFIAARTS